MGSVNPEVFRKREDLLFECLHKYIGKPCPTNDELAKIMGGSKWIVRNALWRLSDRRKIKIVFPAITKRQIIIPGEGETLPTVFRSRNKQEKAAEKREELLKVLESYRGFPCPTTKELAKLLKSDYGTTNYRLQRLAREGRLKILRVNSRRRKFIFADGTETEVTKIFCKTTGRFI